MRTSVAFFGGLCSALNAEREQVLKHFKLGGLLSCQSRRSDSYVAEDTTYREGTNVGPRRQ
jgi:hypothetical protein